MGCGCRRQKRTLFLVLCLVFFTILYRLYVMYSSKRFCELSNSNQCNKHDINGMWIVNHVTMEIGGSEHCDELYQPDGNARGWQSVDSENHTYVFSAYLDQGISPQVRVIAIRKASSRTALFCQQWFGPPHRRASVGEAIVSHIPESHEMPYTASLVLCRLKSRDIPTAVSVVSEKCQVARNIIQLAPSEKSDVLNNFTVCVSPLNRHYSRITELIETIEVNTLFGANKFAFYNHSTGPEAEIVLGHYKTDGLADVIQWNVPLRVDGQGSPPEIHYFGQLTMLNDCLYRYRYTSMFIVFTDLDEIVVPRQHTSWIGMIQNITAHQRFAAFLFPCTFFRRDWGNITEQFHGKVVAEHFNLVTLLKVFREEQIFPHLTRSKVIVRPEMVSVMGVHQTWFGGKCYNVPYSLGLLHHYRDWENPNDGKIRITDKYMHTFRDSILLRVARSWNRMPPTTFGSEMSERPNTT